MARQSSRCRGRRWAACGAAPRARRRCRRPTVGRAPWRARQCRRLRFRRELERAVPVGAVTVAAAATLVGMKSIERCAAERDMHGRRSARGGADLCDHAVAGVGEGGERGSRHRCDGCAARRSPRRGRGARPVRRRSGSAAATARASSGRRPARPRSARRSRAAASPRRRERAAHDRDADHRRGFGDVAAAEHDVRRQAHWTARLAEPAGMLLTRRPSPSSTHEAGAQSTDAIRSAWRSGTVPESENVSITASGRASIAEPRCAHRDRCRIAGHVERPDRAGLAGTRQRSSASGSQSASALLPACCQRTCAPAR